MLNRKMKINVNECGFLSVVENAPANVISSRMQWNWSVEITAGLNPVRTSFQFIRLFNFFIVNMLQCCTAMIHIHNNNLPTLRNILFYLYLSVLLCNKFGLDMSINLENKPYLFDIEDTCISRI